MTPKAILRLILVCSTLCTGAELAPNLLWQDAVPYGYTATSIAVSPDGRYAASPGGNGVQIWRVSDGAKITSWLTVTGSPI